MLNFDEARFLRIQTGALAQGPRLHAVMHDLLAAGATELFFLGAGGAGLLMQPAAQLLQQNSTFPVHLLLPAELVETGSARLGEHSIVVIPSLSGTTAESVAALAYCQARGATALVLTGHAETPLARDADHAFVSFAEDDTSCESFYLQSLAIALAVLEQRGEIDDHDDVVAQLDRLPALLVEAKRAFEPQARTVAEHLAAHDYHVITGAGGSWTPAWYYGMCILEEMQWIRTRPVHASDFFHGTLELVEDGVSVVVLKGEDATRPLLERVEKFVPTVSSSMLVLDSADAELAGVPQRVRALVSHVVLATLLERVSAHLEVLRDHPLTTRRYYKRVQY